MKKKVVLGNLGNVPAVRSAKKDAGPLREPASRADCATASYIEKPYIRTELPERDASISTSILDQRMLILQALRAGPKTTYELRCGGSFQSPTRIFELRETGYNIQTTRVSVTDRDGFTHVRVARYELIAEPAGSAA